MRANRLRIMLCHANCPKCSMPTEFRMFESGLGGDFETYVGVETGTIYRLDLGKVHYQKLSRADLMAESLKKEGRLLRTDKEIRCKICGTVFEASNGIPIDGEEIIDAYEL